MPNTQTVYEERIRDVRRWYIGSAQTESELKGEASETAFEIKTSYLIKYGMLWWAQGISRAPSSQDILERIDFKIRAVMNNTDGSKSEFQILIQTKSTRANLFGQYELFRKNGDHIHIVVIDKHAKLDNLKYILNTIYRKEIARRQ